MSESSDFVTIKLLPTDDVNEMMEQLFPVFKGKSLSQQFSALVYCFAMLIRGLPPSERKRLVRAMVKPILAVSADISRSYRARKDEP